MANIVNIIDRNIPPQQRILFLDGSLTYNILAGDSLMIKESLGRSAQKVTITGITGNLVVSFNTLQTVIPFASDSQGLFGVKKKLLSQSTPVNIKTTTVTIGPAEVFTLDNDILIDDIYVSSRGAAFEIIAS